jgi:drug/metabolite transporter (DMT)-like permease
MAVILGLAAAMAYGAADFLGGLTSRRNSVISVVLISQTLGFLLLLAALPLLVNGPLDAPTVWWGIACGLVGSAGICLLYLGLARGRMSVVGPVAAVETACLPLIWGLVSGERPGPVALAGVGVAVVAIALVSAARDPAAAVGERRRSGLPEALGSGFSIGLYLILLDQTPADSGAWPLAVARVASLTVFGVAALIVRSRIRPTPGTAAAIVAAGTLDVTANVLYLVGSRAGLLTIVAVLTSLYPAATILLARTVLKERLSGLQIVGLGLAVGGVVLITLG